MMNEHLVSAEMLWHHRKLVQRTMLYTVCGGQTLDQSWSFETDRAHPPETRSAMDADDYRAVLHNHNTVITLRFISAIIQIIEIWEVLH